MSAPYHNQSVIDKVIEEQNCTYEEAESFFKGMLQFLDVAALTDEPVSPSEQIDTAWHAFILHTQDYASYCQERFGKFIHHQPTNGEGGTDNYKRAYHLAQEHFDLDSQAWPPPRELVAAGLCAQGPED